MSSRWSSLEVSIPLVWMAMLFAGQALDAASPTVTVKEMADAPGARTGAAAIYDSKRDRVLVFGGLDADRKTMPKALLSLSLDGDKWQALDVVGASPQAVGHPAMAYDVRRDRLVLFGGWAVDAQLPSAELWTLPLAETPLRWRRIDPPGDAPSARNGTSLCLDAKRDRLLLFGGDTGPHPQFGYIPVNDLWTLDLSRMQWGRLTTTGRVPEPRWNLAATVVSDRDRFVVFGGGGYTGDRIVADSEVHALDLELLRWEQHAPRGATPTPVQGATLTYDPSVDGLLVTGGLFMADRGPAGPDVVWLFRFGTSTWTQMTAKSSFARRDHVGVYVERAGGHLLFGGETPQATGNFYAHGGIQRNAVLLRIMGD